MIAEALTKGWYALVLLPLLIIILPILIVLTILTRRILAHGPQPWLRKLQAVQIVGLLLFYIGTPGFGDTEATLLFGFWPSTVNSSLTAISTWLMIIGAIVAIVATISQAVYLVATWRQHTVKRADSRT